MKRFLALALSALTLLAGASAFAVPAGQIPGQNTVSLDMVAGQRMRTQDGTLAIFTNQTQNASIPGWTGPYYNTNRRKIPMGSLVGAASYYRCKFAYTNWSQYTAVAVVTTGNTHTNTTIDTIASLSGVIAGWTVTGSGIPAGTHVTTSPASAAAGSVTIDQATTSTLTGTALTFTPPPTAPNGSGEVTATGGQITVSGAVLPTWNSGTAPIGLTFNGLAQAILNPGDTVWTDWVYGSWAPNGAAELRTTVFWPANVYLFGTHTALTGLGENYTRGVTTVSPYGTALDQAPMASPTYTGNTQQYMYAPSNMICSAYVPQSAVQPTFAILGDSISVGAWDVNFTAGSASITLAGDANGQVGWAERLLANAGYSYVNVSQSSKRVSDLLTNYQKVAQVIGGGATFALIPMGVNDLANGTSVATLETQWISEVAITKALGMKPIAVTVGTETTSTDGWVTTTNQTASGAFAVGGAEQTFNDWLRSTGAPTYTNGRIVDFADAEMSARDSQVFRVDIAPFADGFGRIVGDAITAGGTSGTNGTFALSFSGGSGTGAAGTCTVAGGVVTALALTNVGINYASAPTATCGSSGLTGATLTMFVIAKRTALHPYSGTDLTGTVIDANATIATYLATQLATAVAIP